MHIILFIAQAIASTVNALVSVLAEDYTEAWWSFIVLIWAGAWAYLYDRTIARG